MREVLHDIRTGKFAKQWIDENAAGKPEYQRLYDADLRPADREGRARGCARKWPGCRASRTRRRPDHERPRTPIASGRAGPRPPSGSGGDLRRPARRRGAGARGRHPYLRLSGRRDHARLRRAARLVADPHPGPARAGGGAGRGRLGPGHRQAGRVPRDLRAGRDQPRHRHRQRLHGQRADGRDHRPGALGPDGHRRLPGGRHLRHHPADREAQLRRPQPGRHSGGVRRGLRAGAVRASRAGADRSAQERDAGPVDRRQRL